MNGETRPTEITVSFVISGRDLDLDECSKVIGRLPSRKWQQKHAHLRARTDLPNSGWIVEIDWTPATSVNDVTSALLDQLWQHRGEISAYMRTHSVSAGVECGVRIWSDPPLYELRQDVICKLCDLHAAFGLSIYDYREKVGS